MSRYGGRHTIFFDGQFWVGVFERWDDDRVEVCRVVFGAEPSVRELWEFLRRGRRLRFGPSVAEAASAPTRRNPKRERREIARQLAGQPVGTKAQAALKQQQEHIKTDRRDEARARRALEQQARYEQHCDKRKQKHKGH
ncbi:MAG: YjdF family protein [Propionibacteriaceae bacterium]|jgi:hypothetical protein|nr:YjdF family protein [Propionibacteriaceae bacterium]